MKKIIAVSIIAIAFAACGGQNQQELAQQRERDSLANLVEQNIVAQEQQRALDSMSEVVAAKDAEVANANAKSSTRQNRTTSVTNNYTTGNAAKQQPATTTKRKGWSSTATGAAIGAGVGAVSGAMIDDKKGRGAVIGGVSGAAVGAGTGAIIDANRKKKEQQND